MSLNMVIEIRKEILDWMVFVDKKCRININIGALSLNDRFDLKVKEIANKAINYTKSVERTVLRDLSAIEVYGMDAGGRRVYASESTQKIIDSIKQLIIHSGLFNSFGE